jgi:hypothetical protein
MGLEEAEIIGGSKYSVSGFFNHVFNFDNENKCNMLNLLQYILIAVIPVIAVLKLIKFYIPEEDILKGTPEILIEVFAQLVIIFFAIWFIDKIIRYIPTYSKANYHKFNEINYVIPTLIILFTMQTRLGSKINILFDRFLELWNGREGNQNYGNVKVCQPIVTPGIHQISRADTLNHNIMQPPIHQMPQNNISMIDSLPNIINGNPSQTQHQAMNMSFMDTMEPMAANGSLGGYGSSF